MNPPGTHPSPTFEEKVRLEQRSPRKSRQCSSHDVAGSPSGSKVQAHKTSLGIRDPSTSSEGTWTLQTYINSLQSPYLTRYLDPQDLETLAPSIVVTWDPLGIGYLKPLDSVETEEPWMGFHHLPERPVAVACSDSAGKPQMPNIMASFGIGTLRTQVWSIKKVYTLHKHSMGPPHMPTLGWFWGSMYAYIWSVWDIQWFRYGYGCVGSKRELTSTSDYPILSVVLSIAEAVGSQNSLSEGPGN